jgi:hypothetical protein
MVLELTLIVPLAALAMLINQAGRRDPQRRARQEAAWRAQIIAAGFREP